MPERTPPTKKSPAAKKLTPKEADIKRLADAVAFVERFHPLPRCEHGSALRDHGGEHLEPPCGCRYSIKERA